MCPAALYMTAKKVQSCHNSDVMMIAMESLITDVSIFCTTVWSGADQRKHQSSASQVFVGKIHRCPVNFPHKGPVMRKTFPVNDVIMPCILGVLGKLRLGASFQFGIFTRILPQSSHPLIRMVCSHHTFVFFRISIGQWSEPLMRACWGAL